MANWGKGATGALQYGSTGASIGGMVGGPLGAGIGAGVGALAGGIHGLFSGGGQQKQMQGQNKSMQQGNALQGYGGNLDIPGYESGQFENMTPEQMEQYKRWLEQAGPDSYLGKLAGGDQGQFAEMEAPAMQQFNELQGGLASRFSGMGTGARRSSGFQNAGTSAASQFAQQLQANRMNIRNQAISGLSDMSNQLLQHKPYERYMTPERQGGLSSFFSAAAPGLAKGFGEAAGSWALNKWGG